MSFGDYFSACIRGKVIPKERSEGKRDYFLLEKREKVIPFLMKMNLGDDSFARQGERREREEKWEWNLGES